MKKTAKRKPAHFCVSQINELLKPHNTMLDLSMSLDFDSKPVKTTVSTIVATTKIDKTKRKPPKMVVATFCPFCGVELSKVGP